MLLPTSDQVQMLQLFLIGALDQNLPFEHPSSLVFFGESGSPGSILEHTLVMEHVPVVNRAPVLEMFQYRTNFQY